METHQPENALILIVDDNYRNLQLLGNVLRSAKYRISVATGGEQALYFVRNNHPDLIILDIMMPEIDGYEVCKQLKEQNDTKDIPIIFVTAKIESEDIVRGFRIGAVDYITKPYNRDELLVRVKNHLTLYLSKRIIKEQAEKLRLVNEQKDQLFSIIGHDLRGPIGNFKNILNYLIENPGELHAGKTKELLELLRDSSINTHNLLENLLLWANNKRGVLNFVPDKIPIVKIFEKNKNLLKNLANDKSISINIEADPALVVKADANMLETIIRNLLSNAIKFTGKTGKITLSATKNQNLAQIAVTDTGVGIDQATKEKILNPDNYFTTYGTGNEKGSGLGLKLCVEFVEVHQSKLTIESPTEGGSKFIFYLPAIEEK